MKPSRGFDPGSNPGTSTIYHGIIYEPLSETIIYRQLEVIAWDQIVIVTKKIAMKMVKKTIMVDVLIYIAIKIH